MIRHLKAAAIAARANLIPGLVLQAVMVTILVAYWTSADARALFGKLVDLKSETGFLFSFLSVAFAGGILPEFLRIALFHKFRPNRSNAVSLTFGILFWGCMGMLIDAFYRLQSAMFGSDPTLQVVATKVIVDMALFTPFVGVPIAVTAYIWKNHDFDFAIFGDVLNLKGYMTHIVPVLIPNWAVWGPVVCVIYALPIGLQMPVYVLAQAFWALVLATLTARRETVSL